MARESRSKGRWPGELRVAIIAADADEIPPTQILRLAKAGQLDGLTRSYSDLPTSTFWAILKAERGKLEKATEPVHPGQEEEAAGAIVRRALEIARRETRRIDQALDQAQTASERVTLARELSQWSKLAASGVAKPKRPVTGQQGSEAAKAAPRSSPIDELIREMEGRQEPASPDVENTGDTSVSTPGRDTAQV